MPCAFGTTIWISILAAGAVQSLHVISPDTCSIPYLIPLSFQKACDRSDEYYSSDAQIRTNSDGDEIISFTIPPQNVTSAYVRRTPNFWTHEPFCLESVKAQNGFCVYTNVNFARGRGISFIATQRAIQDVVKATVFKDNGISLARSNAELSSENAEKYTRAEVEGEKRFEMIAKKPFKRGELLHSRTPIVVIQDPLMTYMTEEDQTLLLRIAVDRLPLESQRWFLSQYAQDGKDPFIDRMDKNAFNAQVGKSIDFFSAAVPETAQFNHDCRPNTAYHFHPETLALSQHVMRDIQPGEEITISYLPPYANSTRRADRLQSQWGFECSCKLCSSSDFFRRQSDSRLRRMQSIINALNVPPSERKPNPAAAERLIELHKQEGLWGPLAGAQMYAAMEYQLSGNKEKAKEWAKIAKESTRIWSGIGHEFHTAMMTILGEKQDENIIPYKRLI